MKHILPKTLLLASALSAPLTMMAQDGLTPQSVTIQAVPDVAANTITLTVNVPSEAGYPDFGTPLPSLDKVEIFRTTSDGTEEKHLIKEYLNPTPGDVYTLTDTENLTAGNNYVYSGIAHLGENASYESTCYVFLGILPGTCSDMTAQCPTPGQPPVKITFTAPTVNDVNKPLDCELTKIEVCRTQTSPEFGTREVLYTLENPVAGETYTYDDAMAQADARYVYAVKAYTMYGGGYDATANILVGFDSPGQVENLKATATDNGVLLTWDAPTRGQNDGQLDYSQIVYKVTRVDSGDNTVLTEDLAETTYTDVIEGVETQKKINYQVQALNAEGKRCLWRCVQQRCYRPGSHSPL